MRPIKTLTVHFFTNTFLFYIMSKSVALGMLRQGQTGAQILEILNALTAEIVQENIQDCADHYAAISADFEF